MIIGAHSTGKHPTFVVLGPWGNEIGKVTPTAEITHQNYDLLRLSLLKI